MSNIKSAYELAQERLGAPPHKLSDAQKEQLAEIEKLYAAKLAETELAAHEKIRAARFAGEEGKAAQLAEQLAADLTRLREEKERRKNQIRTAK